MKNVYMNSTKAVAANLEGLRYKKFSEAQDLAGVASNWDSLAWLRRISWWGCEHNVDG